MGIVTQVMSRDKVAWAFCSTSGNLSLLPDRKETTLNDDGDGGGGGEGTSIYINCHCI